jgi:hypothetical protein
MAVLPMKRLPGVTMRVRARQLRRMAEADGRMERADPVRLDFP